MHWIHKFNKGIYQIYAGNTIEAFQPLDFFHFLPLWYDLWIEKIAKVMDMLELDKKSYHEIKKLLPTPSNLRAILQKIMPSYRAFTIKNPAQVKRVTEFFARMLMEACPTDPFAENSSPLHSPEEIAQLLQTLPWKTGTPEAARACGRLVAAAGSLAHGLYNDVVTDMGWDSYGPHQIGDNQTLLITHFPDLQTPELWGTQFRASIKELYLYRLYTDVRWKLAGVGCHTVLQSGNPITGLTKYIVVADGKVLSDETIVALTKELATKAELIYQEIRKKSFEELKQMVLLQECYQLKKLLTAANLDWKPTAEMYARVKDKPLLTGLIPHGKMVTSVEEYKEMFGINEFIKEVLNLPLSPHPVT
ncbi:MAG TPA: hypothetical protein VJA27_02645 [Patescibacteria group bacterium]|nr:hypothetical protein [Patescibacteria group bacterium]